MGFDILNLTNEQKEDMVKVLQEMKSRNLVAEVKEYFGDDLHAKIQDNYSSEFHKAKPKTPEELLEFYRTSKGYLFANAQHCFPGELIGWDKKGRVLDFGAGAGVHSYHLAKLGHDVEFLDINVPQQVFAEWLIKTREIENMKVVQKPEGMYDYMVLADVIEHLEDYKSVMVELIPHLKIGGEAYLKPQFDERVKDGMHIHFADKFGFDGLMRQLGMVRVNGLIWRREEK